MWFVFAFIVIHLPGIVFAQSVCGLPAIPRHGILRPNKPFYDYGDRVRVICEENYRLFEENTSDLICDHGEWIGKPSVCLQNLAYGRPLKHFGSPSGGKSRPRGGIFSYDVVDARESVFFDLFFGTGTTHVYIRFHGNFSVTDQHGTELPFEQSVLAFNTGIHFYEECTKSTRGGIYDCISPDERLFIGAKVEIFLLNKTIDMSKNSIQVKLQLENNGFVVLDVADRDCGTPPIPFRGSVSTTANSTVATYSCTPGYTLHGKSVQTCDVTKYPEITWVSKTPICLKNFPNLQTIHEEPSTASNTVVIAVVSTVGCVLIISIVTGIIWVNKKTKAQQQTSTTVASSEPLIDLSNTVNSGNDSFNSRCLNSSFLPMPPLVSTPVQYPLVVSQNYLPSQYSSWTSYQNSQSNYANAQMENLYSTIDDD